MAAGGSGLVKQYQLVMQECTTSEVLTLGLELHVGLLHNPKVWVGREHLGPFLHALQNLRFHLLVRIL